MLGLHKLKKNIMNKQDLIKKTKRVVIKIGSALLIDSETGKLHKNWLETLAFDINNLIKQLTDHKNMQKMVGCYLETQLEQNKGSQNTD